MCHAAEWKHYSCFFFPLFLGRFNFTPIDVRSSLLFPRKAHTQTYKLIYVWPSRIVPTKKNIYICCARIIHYRNSNKTKDNRIYLIVSEKLRRKQFVAVQWMCRTSKPFRLPFSVDVVIVVGVASVAISIVRNKEIFFNRKMNLQFST